VSDLPVRSFTAGVSIAAVHATLQDLVRSTNAQAQIIKGLKVINGLTTTQAQAVSGMFATAFRLLDFHNTDGSALAAAASAGKFGFSITPGTQLFIVGEAAQANTKTDDAIIEAVLPPWFVSGSGITATVNASLTGAGVAGTHTAEVKAWRTANNGTQGVNLGPGVGVNITAAGADMTFAIAGATLNPGDRIMLELEVVLQETGGAATLTAVINSVRLG